MPFFDKLNTAGNYTLSLLPKSILYEAQTIPGVTRYNMSINHQLFDRNQYNLLLHRLLYFAKHRLTTVKIVEYILKTIKYPIKSSKKHSVLYISHEECDYMKEFMLHGFTRIFEENLYVFKPPKYMYEYPTSKMWTQEETKNYFKQALYGFGHPSENIERFLESIKNITKANDESENQEILEIARGKLIPSAGLWFDNNKHNFKKWADFEIVFRNRYFSTTMIHKKFSKLQQRIQLHDEPVTSYIDDVINLCREIDPNISDSIIIQHLMNGINLDLKNEISRHDSCMNVLNEFLKYAKIEQDLYDTFEKSNQPSTS
ncbi:unnamed protein product [Rotaria sordida]|uniref:Retrotransposon gag domain-containing protein n=1 Tax=Rotaria sordida TaxID=392033 RepID=A0A820BDN0_9BILA|nr:unnamed protein product [Rotaria sordida]